MTDLASEAIANIEAELADDHIDYDTPPEPVTDLDRVNRRMYALHRMRRERDEFDALAQRWLNELQDRITRERRRFDRRITHLETSLELTAAAMFAANPGAHRLRSLHLLEGHPMTDLAPNPRTEWLAWRKLGIGASDIAALIGMSKWASPMSVWADKMGLGPPDDGGNDYTEFGHRAEPMMVGYFEDRNPGLFVVGQQDRRVHPEFDWHRCTLDGLVVEHPDGDPVGVLEIKTTGEGEWDHVPDAYACQVQWQMHVSGLPHAWMAVLHGRKYRTYQVERDDRAIATLCEVADEFWTRYVLGETPPPADSHEATSKALAHAFPEPVPGKAADLDDLVWALDLREQAQAQASEAKVLKARAENAIKAAMGHAEIGRLGGEPVVTYKLTRRDAHTVAASEYRTLRTVGARR